MSVIVPEVIPPHESSSYIEIQLENATKRLQQAQNTDKHQDVFYLALIVMAFLSRLDSNHIQKMVDKHKELQNEKMKEIQTTTFNGRLAYAISGTAIAIQVVGATAGFGLLSPFFGATASSQSVVTAITTLGSAVSSTGGIEKDNREQGRMGLQHIKDNEQREMQNKQQRKEGVSGSQKSAEQNLQQTQEAAHRAFSAMDR